MDIDAIRETLVHLGITPSILAGIGLFSVITLFFSVRVVLIWYLGVQRVQEELNMVLRQLANLQIQISKLQMKQEPRSEDEPRAPQAAENGSRNKDTFRLNH